MPKYDLWLLWEHFVYTLGPALSNMAVIGQTDLMNPWNEGNEGHLNRDVLYV